ncbi:MAG: hypothetical protein PHH71_03150, partial [Clostridia bacterium]|nr:hypothetical protein [Clostridia bacterium]
MKINVKEEGFFSGYGIEKKDIFFILILILIAIFGFSFNAKAETLFFEDFDSYSDGYYLKDISNWSVSTYGISPLISNNYSVSSPLSLRLPPASHDNYHYYYFDDPINEDFIFSFDFLTTYVNRDGFRLLFLDNDPTKSIISQIQFTIPAHPAEVYIQNGSGGVLSVYSNMGAYTWYDIDIEFSFSTYSIRINVNDTGWSDWVAFYNNNMRDQIDSFSLYYETKPYQQNTNFYLDNLRLSSGWEPVVGLPDCGSDDGLVLNSTPTNLCNNGQADTPVFDGIKWDWSCSSGQ